DCHHYQRTSPSDRRRIAVLLACQQSSFQALSMRSGCGTSYRRASAHASTTAGFRAPASRPCASLAVRLLPAPKPDHLLTAARPTQAKVRSAADAEWHRPVRMPEVTAKMGD